jgi:hypothetical protein
VGDFCLTASEQFLAISQWEQGTFWWVNDDVHFTLEWANGCSFTPNEQLSAISWREKVIFDELMMMSALY